MPHHLVIELAIQLVDGLTITVLGQILIGLVIHFEIKDGVGTVHWNRDQVTVVGGIDSSMKPPIIVYEPGDVAIFRSVKDAERYIEPPHVLEGLYIAYDSTGKMLDLRAPGAKTKNFLGIKISYGGKVTISAAESDPSHAEDLKKVLRDLLKDFGISSEWLQTAKLEDLLNKGIETVGFTR